MGKRGARLSPLDAAMLYLENDVANFNIAGICRVESPISYENFLSDFSHRVELLPRFRQRITPVPLWLGHPTWEDDVDFDLRRHVRHVQLPSPGGDAEVRNWLREVMSARLDLRRPLWEAYVVNGFEDGGGALVVKMHHALTDGMGAQKIYGVVLDFEPLLLRTRPAEVDPNRYVPAPPSALRMAHALADGFRTRIRAVRRVPGALADGLSMILGTGPNAPARAIIRETAKAPAVRFKFNSTLSGKIHHSWTSLPLKDVRAICTPEGGKVNDVYLTLLGATIERYAAREGIDTTGKFLRIYQAANTRPTDDFEDWGNRVAVMPALVPLDADPHARFQQVVAFTQKVKAAKLREQFDSSIQRALTLLPVPLLRLNLMMVFSTWRSKLADKLARPPAINMYVTNVNWPEIDAYVAGQRLELLTPLIPVMPGVGLTCAAITYGNSLKIAFSADSELLPDVERLAADFNEAYHELRRAAETRRTGTGA